jgi:hypothetical protein
MDSLTYDFTLISETFAHGAYQTQNFNRPELRAPSLKGVIRSWHEALGYSKADALTIFGQVSDRRNGIDGNFASRIMIRVTPLSEVRTGKTDFMPHKGANGGSKSAIEPGARYRLMITQRRETLPPPLWEQVKRATQAWLFLGAVGQRANRGCGCPWPAKDAPTTPAAYLDACGNLLNGTRIRVALLDYQADTSRMLRDVSGRFPRSTECNIPGAVFGSVDPRKPSPLKLRAVQLNDRLHLAAVWLPRDPYNDTAGNLRAGIEAMIQIPGKKDLGLLLQKALPIFAS